MGYSSGDVVVNLLVFLLGIVLGTTVLAMLLPIELSDGPIKLAQALAAPIAALAAIGAIMTQVILQRLDRKHTREAAVARASVTLRRELEKRTLILSGAIIRSVMKVRRVVRGNEAASPSSGDEFYVLRTLEMPSNALDDAKSDWWAIEEHLDEISYAYTNASFRSHVERIQHSASIEAWLMFAHELCFAFSQHVKALDLLTSQSAFSRNQGLERLHLLELAICGKSEALKRSSMTLEERIRSFESDALNLDDILVP